RVRPDVDVQEQIPRRRAGVAAATLAPQPDLLPVLDPGRDPGGDRAALGGPLGDRVADRRLPERDRRPGLDVLPAARPAGGAVAATEPAEAAQQVLEVDRLGPAAGRAEADVAGPAAT